MSVNMEPNEMPEPIDVQAVVAELKAEIAAAMSNVISRCRREHGVTPSAISLNMVDVTEMQHETKQYVLGDVGVRFDF